MTVKEKDLGYRKIINEVKKYKKLIVKAGIFRESGTNNGQYIVDYAAANEFGTIDNGGYIPERSFIRSTSDEKSEEWRKLLDKYLTYVVENKYSAEQSLNFIGLQVVNDIKDKISSNIAPENAPATKLKKAGSESANTTTLIDTGTMRNSVYHIITKDK